MRPILSTVTVALCGLLLLTLSLAAGAADQETPTKYVLELSTDTMALPFAMPAMPNLPNIPGLGDMFKPKRLVHGEALYPTAAVDPIFVTVPGDLKLKNDKLPLTVEKPMTGQTPGDEAPGTQPQTGQMQIITKLYWHPDTAEGPLATDVTIDMSQLPQGGPGPMQVPSAEWQQMLAERARTAAGTTDTLPEKVVGQGNYTLNTGNLTMPLAGFLPPLKVTSPAALNDVNLPDGIEIKWDPVPGALGFILHAFSMTREGDKSTLIRWVSTLHEPPQRVRDDYQQETTIADDLANGVLLPPETVLCKVPAGIFPEKPDMFMLDVIAVGQDYYDHANGVTLVGKIRARWTGMKMGNLPGLPGMPPAEDDEG